MIDRTEALGGSPNVEHSGARSRADNRLVRAVARIPWRVRTKLLAAFVGIVLLFVVVGLLGLRALSQSEARVESLGTLQLRAAAYREIRTGAAQLRQLLALRAGGRDVNTYVGGSAGSLPSGDSLTFLDRTIATTLQQLGPATDTSKLDFVPPAGERRDLDRVRRDYLQVSAVMSKISAFDQVGSLKRGQQLQHARAEPLANELGALADQLSSTTQADTSALIAQNRSSFANSRRLFIAVGAGTALLALGLGFILSWSLVVPIQRTEARLSEIAAGDFAGHVDVANRDELGVLAANVNRMNDELGRLYDELETVSQHKSDFLANMSHELRTPLNAIIGFSEVLQQQMFGELNQQQLGYVDDVLVAGRHLLSLINDILDLAKIEAGRMELEPADFDLPQAIDNALVLVRERALRRGITLDQSIDPRLGEIKGDERKIKQVLLNLLSNAVKFTPEGGRIDVRAALADGAAEVSVTDTGVGIAPEDHAAVFEEFRQVGTDYARKHEGTGLGLALARKFVELHGGTIRVESQLGRGATFTFTIPVTPWQAS